jgi:DNA-binding response OmpR family regulator
LAKILLVEDDPDLTSLIANILHVERHTVETVVNGDEALGRLKMFKYELVILDWMLPGLTGMDICTEFRGKGGNTPILMLTSKSTPEEKEKALDGGADDYLTKPFHPKELMARIRALLRRPQTVNAKILQIGDVVLDSKTMKVFKKDEEIHLLPKEFSLLELFLRYPNQVFSGDALLDRVWASESAASVDTVRTYIKTLRKKIDSDSGTSLIRTVHGVGYCLDAEVN